MRLRMQMLMSIERKEPTGERSSEREVVLGEKNAGLCSGAAVAAGVETDDECEELSLTEPKGAAAPVEDWGCAPIPTWDVEMDAVCSPKEPVGSTASIYTSPFTIHSKWLSWCSSEWRFILVLFYTWGKDSKKERTGCRCRSERVVGDWGQLKEGAEGRRGRSGALGWSWPLLGWWRGRSRRGDIEPRRNLCERNGNSIEKVIRGAETKNDSL